ncbi:hypothetical protein F4810DRAFT_706769 [Camillea tinctor]|nr:hypothetical protein F4810DRAFT_706769 [Camillea tinctor]
MLYIVRQVAALVVVASLFLTAEALPSVTKDLARGSDPSLYIHPSFVPTTVNETEDALESHWKDPFTGAAQVQFICDSQLPFENDNPGALIDDCKAAMNELLGMRGYWDCSEWVSGNSFKYFSLFGKGTCQVSVASLMNSPARIGNGDVYAWISKTIQDHKQGNTAAAQGDTDCNGSKVYWSLSSRKGSSG